MNLGLIKSGIQLVSGIGVGFIADEAVKMAKPKNLIGLKKVAVRFGGLVLSMMVADKATDYVGDVWDKTVGEIKSVITPTEEVTEEEIEA